MPLDFPPMSRLGSRQQKTHEVLSPRNVSTVLIDHSAARALAYRQRAIELAEAARRENDKGQRRFLLDKARNMVSVADALDPQPPDEPQVFSK
jgi:ABC-type uncharacterized transport system ATPase component